MHVAKGGGGGGGGDFISMLNIRMSRTPIEGSQIQSREGFIDLYSGVE